VGSQVVFKKLWSVVNSRTDTAMVVGCTTVITVAFCGRLASQIASENLLVYIESNLSVLLEVLDDLIKLTKKFLLYKLHISQYVLLDFQWIVVFSAW
jgi:hypothetical protein